MSWIKEANLPDLPAISQVLSLNSEALEAVKGLNETLAFGNSTLSRMQEEAIATVVAVANQCRYGALTHGGFLRRHSGDSGLASQLLADYTQAELSTEDLRMLDFALKVTLEPASLTEDDVEGLRTVGFLDDEILSIVLITCLFNFMDRVASSLGVEIPSNFQRVVENWLTGPATEQAWLLHTGEDPPQEASVQAEAQAPRAPGIPELPRRKLSHSQQGAVMEPKAPPKDAPGPRPRPADEKEGRGSPQSSVPEDADEDEGSGSLSDPSRDTAPGDTERNSGTEETVGKKHPRPFPGPGEEIIGDEDEDEEEEAGDSSSPTLREPGPLERFVKEMCIVSLEQASTARDLYIAYIRWCDENRLHPWRQRNFGLGLAGLGFRRRRRGQGRHWWMGIGLWPDQQASV